MQTSVQWWESVKNDEAKTNEWLIKQYRGEVTASKRILQFAGKFSRNNQEEATLAHIASQEAQHAEWVLGLLKTRGIDPSVENAEDRYWSHALPGIIDFETGTAVAAHAEGMRLERIRAIASDENAPGDIREVFKKILKDEEWHEKAFTQLSSPEALEATKENHEVGLQSLGLVV